MIIFHFHVIVYATVQTLSPFIIITVMIIHNVIVYTMYSTNLVSIEVIVNIDFAVPPPSFVIMLILKLLFLLYTEHLFWWH